MICNNCGRTIKDNAKFCGFCGSEVAFGGETASAPVSVKDEIKRHIVLFLVPYVYLALELIHLFILNPIIAARGIESLIAYYGVTNIHAHRAIGDVEVTAKVFAELVRFLG